MRVFRNWMVRRDLPSSSGRILAAVAQRFASLHVPNLRSDRDALVATTALVHGMTLVTTTGYADDRSWNWENFLSCNSEFNPSRHTYVVLSDKSQ